MQIRCPACQAVYNVPPEKAGIPGLRCRCRCGNLFPVASPPADEPVPQPATATRTAEAQPTPAAPPAPPSPPAATATARPAPPAAAAPRAAASSTAAPGATAAIERPLPGPAWRRCARHPSKPSTCVCRSCAKGYCVECEQRVQNVPVCPECDGLCALAAEYLRVQERERQRQQPLLAELPAIATYPLVDPVAFVMLAIVTGVFGFMARLAAYGGSVAAQASGLLLSTGILTWYAFTAAARVSNGNRTSFMPEFGDLSDIMAALKLAGAAMAISVGPLFLSLLLLGADLPRGIGAAPEPEEGIQLRVPTAPTPPPEAGLLDEADAAPEHAPTTPVEALDEAPSTGRLLLHVLVLGLAALWALVYAPVALTVAAVSRSLLQTLNPLLGVGTIVRMGSTYWQAAAVYAVVVLVAGGLSLVLSLIPVVGHFVRAFVDAYAYLVVGCLIGLAVDKRAEELDLA